MHFKVLLTVIVFRLTYKQNVFRNVLNDLKPHMAIPIHPNTLLSFFGCSILNIFIRTADSVYSSLKVSVCFSSASCTSLSKPSGSYRLWKTDFFITFSKWWAALSLCKNVQANIRVRKLYLLLYTLRKLESSKSKCTTYQAGIGMWIYHRWSTKFESATCYWW